MRKLIAVGIIATLVLASASVAFGGGSQDRIVAKRTAGSHPSKKPLARSELRLAQGPAARIKCRTVGCVNRTLTSLKKNVKRLKRDAFVCEQFVNVTSYVGYLYNDGVNTFPTSALDYTAEGDTPSDRFVVYTC